MLAWVVSLDFRLARRVNRWPAPRWIRLWAIAATRSGDGWLWYALAGVIALFGGASRWQALASSSAAVAVGIAVFLALKPLAGRRRPNVYERNCWGSLRAPDRYSFPSGHTITAFAVAVSLGRFYPHARPELLAVAASVGASRVITGMHFLSDVLAGAAIGWGLALGSGFAVGLAWGSVDAQLWLRLFLA